MLSRPLLAALLLAAAAAAAPPPPSPRLKAPEAQVQGYRFVIEEVSQQQYEQTDFPPGGMDKATAKPAGRQSLALKLAVYPPQASMLPNIDGLDSKITATVGGDKPVVLTHWPLDDANPLLGGVWRNQLMAQDVDLAAPYMKRLEGDLIVYPKARTVTLDFPLKAGTTKMVDGFRATLKTVKLRSDTLSVLMETEWPTSLSVTRPNPDSPSGIAAVTKSGLALMPSGGSTSNNDRTGFTGKVHNLSFVDVKDPPDVIRVEALVRSGGAHKIHFSIPEVPLPDSMSLDGDPSDAHDPGPLDAGDPFYTKGGGTLLAPLVGKSAGRLMIGLSRIENGVGGPWRWLLPNMEHADRATLGSVKPGKYRVVRAWLPPVENPDLEPVATPVRLGEAMEVQIEAGATVTLPAVNGRETR
jgi:hypothetical protein